jgi:hypothetical protein
MPRPNTIAFFIIVQTEEAAIVSKKETTRTEKLLVFVLKLIFAGWNFSKANSVRYHSAEIRLFSLEVFVHRSDYLVDV